MIARRKQVVRRPVRNLVRSLLAVFMLISTVARSDESSAARRTDTNRPADRVVITVNSVALAKGHEVMIADVARIEGGDAALRDRIGRLDLADAPPAGKTTRITQDVIAYRIQIAGIEARSYQIEGARTVALTRQTYQVPETDIVATARQFVLNRLPWNADDITIETSQPIRGPVLVSGSRETVRFQVSLRSTRVPLGIVRTDVAVFSNGTKQAEVPVTLDVRLHQTIAVAARRVERAQPLTSQNVYFERRAVDASAGYLTETESPIGQRAKRLLMPLQPITTSDVEPSEPSTPVVVKQRDAVQLVARVGNLVVTATGEALQDGRAGEMIRVRNVDSKTVVTGRIVSRDEVRVLY